MSESNANESSVEAQHGIFIRGIYLGIEEGRTFTPRGSTEERTVRPKLGVAVNGEEVAIAARDDAHAASARRGLVKGDVVEVLVEPLPPFGSRGEVTYTLPGTYERNRSGNWK